MQGVQATLKLFRALWEQYFFVGHFWQKKIYTTKIICEQQQEKKVK